MSVVIRKPKLTDLKSWNVLWKSYLVFYQSEGLANEITDLLWQRIHTLENPIRCLVAQDKTSNKVVAFVHYLSHADTWKKHDVCYLEDLFVDQKNRGKGIGEALINAVQEQAIEQHWHKVYWHTKHDNKQARALYDKLTGGTDGFISYRLVEN